jgi:hypothetical protein
MFPLLCAVLGFILTSFEFQRSWLIETVGIEFRMELILGTDVPIYGGLTPVNSSLVDQVPSEIETIFFTEYSYGIVQSAQYVIGIDPVTDCGGGSCTSIFLPGGVEMARLRTDGLNQTLFDGQTTLANADIIVISGAPGYQLEFYEPENYTFGPGDCSTYGLDQGQGWHICIGSENSTIFAGITSSIFLS